MNSAREYLAQIAHSAESQYPSTRLATSHAHVTRKVRRHRTARAAATTVAGVGVVGGGGWGALMAFGSSNDEGVPGASAASTAPAASPTTAPGPEEHQIAFAAGDRLDAWVADTAFVLRVEADALLAAIADAAPGEADPEGWIKPGKYFIATDGALEQVATQLVAQRISQFEVLGVPRDQWQDVLTKASLVQAETPLDADMPKVARVIQNRLDQAMPLQLESPLFYVVRPDLNVVSDDGYAVDSPYNTYLYEGLPPAAINSPSDAAIDAVLHPAEGDWLYFVVANPDTGETRFGTTFEEHAANLEHIQTQ
jgi:UPF0755 protein